MPPLIGNDIMGYGESDTRAKLIDPAIHTCGWTEDLIRREETAGAIEIGLASRRSTRTDRKIAKRHNRGLAEEGKCTGAATKSSPNYITSVQISA